MNAYAVHEAINSIQQLGVKRIQLLLLIFYYMHKTTHLYTRTWYINHWYIRKLSNAHLKIQISLESRYVNCMIYHYMSHMHA